jgi:hypothetical protein
MAWFDASFDQWRSSLLAATDEDLDAPHLLHWRATAPLFDIVVLVANHWAYHAGEINEILSIVRGEAWEYTEEVEENHISTAGHRIRPGWMNDARAQAYETYIAARDRELHSVTKQSN